jgi:hypothetical protein
MEKSPHIMLIGAGAETFAAAQGLEQVPPAFFFTERRWQGLVEALKAKNLPIPARPEGAPPPPATPMAANAPSLRGMSPWILKDFRSPRRQHPVYQQGWNRKGLISPTGRRKAAFKVLADYYEKLAGEGR